MSHVDSVRRFNRFYTKQIGVLSEGLLDSSFSLSEVRVLYEIAHRDRPTAAELAQDLQMDRGYLSRMLQRFVKARLVSRETSRDDARESHLSLTAKGSKTFATLNDRSHNEIATLLRRVPRADQRRLVDSMSAIESILSPSEPEKPTIVIRTHQPGDLGWIVHRHGALYAEEYGYDEKFEGLVAKIVGEFLEHFDAKRERCWMAEKDGEIVGAVMLVKKTATIAKLRLLFVEPSARGFGVGGRLIEECVRFARQAGYRKITLWTQSELGAARHLYEKAGFELVKKQPHKSWSRNDLVSEVWDLKL